MRPVKRHRSNIERAFQAKRRLNGEEISALLVADAAEKGILDEMEWTAHIGADGAIYFQAHFARAGAAGGAMPIPDQVSRIRPGESFEGKSFEYWRALLEQQGGAIILVQ